MKNWLDRRTLIFDTLIIKYGELTPEVHLDFIKELKKLERISKKAEDKFYSELSIIIIQNLSIMLKQKIQSDFIIAMKSQDVVAKNALNSLKAKITEAEKANGNKELDEAGVIKVITNAIKQRSQSIDEFTKGGRLELVKLEEAEIKVLEVYLPVQLTPEEIKEKIAEVAIEFASLPNLVAKMGRTMGTFNKKYQGQANPSLVKTLIEEYYGYSQA
jgi:uncharacterized protein YqeY